MMSKKYWFKRKSEKSAESPSKKRKWSREMETLPKGWKLLQKDG